MSNLVPATPKIYHIAHIDRLQSILGCGQFLSDKIIVNNNAAGTTIGMNKIKQRRMSELTLKSTHPHLYVGDCVPFYFCPRSVMLYMFHMGNSPDIDYKGGQTPIIHFEADLHRTIHWANSVNKCWAFTTSNAGSYYFEDFSNVNQLGNINWSAVNARNWSACREDKQAEFLVENSFDWSLVDRIGVHSLDIYNKVQNILSGANHRPIVEIKTDWYY